MKHFVILLSILSLTACGGGSGSGSGNTDSTTPGTPGQSAYELWLAEGHTGTEQDFLNWLLSNNNSALDEIITRNFNKKAELDDYVEYGDNNGGYNYHYNTFEKPWAKYNGFTQYNAQWDQTSGGHVNAVYNEKELQLANYGAVFYDTTYSNSPTHLMSGEGYVTNRDIDYGSNAYIPETDMVFKGGTLAYIYKPFANNPDEANKVLIKGDATFTYNPNNPTLELDFDNYYKFTMNFTNANTNAFNPAAYGLSGTNANVTVSGTNHTGVSDYNLPEGVYNGVDANFHSQHFKQNNAEEAVGTYNIPSYSVGDPNHTFQIGGAFGGPKQ